MKTSLFAATAAIAIISATANSPVAAQSPRSARAEKAIRVASDPALAKLAAQVNIPYEQFTLPNGLRVLVHTDRKAPVVAVSVWYNVGSKHEPVGKTGFAHLFEHLMFNGSENADDDFFEPLQQMGATDLNGTTWYDRTNYYETVPTGALEKTLWLESDRMGYLLGAITQEKLDNQRGVVQNEKRQGDNRPFGLVQYFQTRALYPSDHPYGHTTIGSMADLDAASLSDVQNWFKAHYGPNNAIVVLAGDIDVPTAQRLMSKYFGRIKSGPTTKPVDASVPTLISRKDEMIRDRVSTTRLYRSWIVPGVNGADTIPLNIGVLVLGGLASSRLDNILVRDEQLAVQVQAYMQSFAQNGQVDVIVDVKPGVDPAKVSARLDAILADYITKGPSEAEVRRAASQQVAYTVKSLESVAGKASVIAEGLLFSKDPERYKKELAAYSAAKSANVQAALAKWLGRPSYALTVVPGERTSFPEPTSSTAPKPPAALVTEARRIARIAPPPVAAPETLTFPSVERTKLSSGVTVIYARRAAVPMTLVSLSLDAGIAADPISKRGLATFTTSLLAEGTIHLGAVAIAERKEELGATINAGSSMDRTTVSMSALSINLGESLDLFADIALHPAFNDTEIERVRGQILASIAADATNPQSIAANQLARALYGPNHPYGVGSARGTPESVKALSRDDLLNFHRAWFRPDKATFFVVSDKPLAEIAPLLEERFGSWRGEGTAGIKDVGMAKTMVRPRILLVDRKDSPQSQISAGQLLGITGREDHLDLLSASDVVGGSFLSRINMDLRETKGWSYGVGAGVSELEGQMTYRISAPVQSDRTGDSIAALINDYKEFLSVKGVTAAELERTQNGYIRGLPGAFETAGTVLGALQANALFGRPDDHYVSLPARYRAQTTTALDAAARGTIDPSALVWVVVGDAAVIRPQLEMLGLPIEVVANK